MAAEERVSVKTTVPAPQKEVWSRHADALDMSRSEFVRSMVQAGRRGFDLEPPEASSPDTNPRGYALKEPVLESLSNGPLEFEEIFEAVTDDVEDLLDETLQALQDENRVQYSRREGYSFTGEANGDD